ncbi:MAG TPA: acyltransferase [Polyangiaceae bacterium]|nr:acyltransferase [Polyangiaceae bacterium]
MPEALPAAPNPFHPIYAVLCLVVALLVLKWFGGSPAAPEKSRRVNSIDGLRGYLGFFVFLHHAAFWYSFVRTKQWAIPDSHLFIHLGQGSVLLFFMITGFLFFAKIRSNQRGQLDWLRLFVSRVLRLTPLYLVIVAIVAVIVGVETHFTLQEPASRVATQALHWLSFCFFDSPPLNGFLTTWLITAGVSWTLRFEWLFYLALPLVGVAIAPGRYIVFGAAAISLLLSISPYKHSTLPLCAFGSGMFAVLCVERPKLRRVLRSRPVAALALAVLVFTVVHFPVTYVMWTQLPTAIELLVLALLTLPFCAIAAGNPLFGALTHPLSRRLGDLSYGLYLLQGIVLYVAFRFVLGFERAAALSIPLYWCVVAVCGGVLVLSSMLAFRFIEAPALRLVNPATSGLRSPARLWRLMSDRLSNSKPNAATGKASEFVDDRPACVSADKR